MEARIYLGASGTPAKNLIQISALFSNHNQFELSQILRACLSAGRQKFTCGYSARKTHSVHAVQ